MDNVNNYVDKLLFKIIVVSKLGIVVIPLFCIYNLYAIQIIYWRYFMKEEQFFSMPGHPSLIDPKERNLDIIFKEPDNGINNETGLLINVSGFGGDMNSNVYKKMRNEFSNNHNLVVVQCNYFGSEFMGSSKNFNIPTSKNYLLNFFNEKDVENLLSNYNENGYISELLSLADSYNTKLTFR